MLHGLAPPDEPLGDVLVLLRLPTADDAGAIAAYAGEPGGLDGTWLPLGPDAPADTGERLVADWLRGWAGGPSQQGPALLVTISATASFVGTVGFGGRADGVELVYGTAPTRRCRGLATRAVVVAARWLIDERAVSHVELRIGPDHSASRRLADRAGFRLVGTVDDVVERTGERYTDLRYVSG